MGPCPFKEPGPYCVKCKGAVPINFGTAPFSLQENYYLETANLTIFPDLSNVIRA